MKWKIVLPVLAAGILVSAMFAIPEVRWRLKVIALKAGGDLDTIRWKQLVKMLSPYSRISIGALASSGNAFAVIRNPFASKDDQARGKELFRFRCAQCHGDAGTGGEGPALVDREFIQGDSDWALFLTISQGIAGTAMRPSKLEDDDVWRLVGYIRAINGELRVGLLSTDEDEAGSEPVHDITYAMLRSSSGEPGDWLLPGGSYNEQRFSKDHQINVQNVSRLGLQWIYQLGVHDDNVESIPLVAGGRIYVTLPKGSVIALDAQTGAQIWRFNRTPPQDLVLCCTANRGVALLGSRLYVATLDAHLLALDAANGRLLWDQTVANYREGYAITSAPLALEKLIVTGVAGGDFPTRGFISAYDANTGALRWRFKTIPEPGESGNETWAGQSWRSGGAATWMTGSFDSDLNVIYWGIGNPAPDFNAAYRRGDNLYSNSVVALNADTGELVWYFQFTPGDDHDWDSVQTPILINVSENGTMRRLLAVANRNGFFYVLDRTNGQYIRAAPFAKQTWAIGLSPQGRPIRSPNATPSHRGVQLFPGMSGATNAQKSAYSPSTQLYYVPVLERSGLFFSSDTPPEIPERDQFLGSGVTAIKDEPHYTAVRAIDVLTAKVRWEFRSGPRYQFSGSMGGLLATDGGLVFGSDVSKFLALDAASGTVMFSFQTGGRITAAPVTYRAEGRQYVAVAAGNVLLAFALPQSEIQQPPIKGATHEREQ